MLFAIDMGNSSTVLGCMEGSTILFEERLSTNREKTVLEYAIDFKNMFELHDIHIDKISGSILSSVVPPLTEVICQAVEKVIGIQPLVIGPGVKNGLHIMIDNPAQLGADLVVGAVAGLAEYKPPMAIIDMGTATTVSVLDEKGKYIGGMILPGIQTALNSLVEETSQLLRIGLGVPKKVIGSNTVDCMKSGIVYGNAACLDGLVDRIEEELGRKVTVLATGGLSEVVVPYCKRDVHLEPHLLLKGLQIIYEMNGNHNVG